MSRVDKNKSLKKKKNLYKPSDFLENVIPGYLFWESIILNLKAYLETKKSFLKHNNFLNIFFKI